MRCLIFTNTPAHVHLYKHVVAGLESRGHDVLVLGRDYGCTVDLLEWYNLPHEVYGRCATTKGSLLSNLPSHYARILLYARRFAPDLIFGVGAYAAHTGAALRAPTVLVTDSEPTSLDHRLSTPFANAVLTPDAFRKDLGENHYVFPGFKECAYLHPEVYERTPSIRDRLGVSPEEPYTIVRLNAFGSHHDIGEGGISEDECHELIEHIADDAHVFVSDEGRGLDLENVPAEPFSLHPARLHDALAEAELLVADTQTMVTEAAMLGTPAIRSNSFVGEDDMGNFVELQENGLIFNVSTFGEILEHAKRVLSSEDASSEWLHRRDRYLEDKCNLTSLLVNVAHEDGDVEAVEGIRQFGEPPVSDREPAATVPEQS